MSTKEKNTSKTDKFLACLEKVVPKSDYQYLWPDNYAGVGIQVASTYSRWFDSFLTITVKLLEDKKFKVILIGGSRPNRADISIYDNHMWNELPDRQWKSGILASVTVNSLREFSKEEIEKIETEILAEFPELYLRPC